MGKILGIDLGTTNSVMAVWDGREPRLIASESGARLTPSVVGFAANGDVFVGEVARRQAVVNARCTVFSAKRFLGQQYEAVAADRDAVPYDVVKGDHGEAKILIGDKRYAPEQISAHVLRELKKSAEAFLGEPVDGAVITVPAYFNDAQRTATKEAGRLAGLDVRRIINEPTAAALAYGLDKIHQKIIAVYDFGGGTFDVSILSVGDDVIEVIATHGDTHLGGDDIDARIVSWLLDKFEDRTGVHVNGDAAAHQRLREAAEHAKIDLTARTSTDINLPFLAADDNGPLHLEVSLSRDELEEMMEDLVERTFASCVQALEDAGKQPAEIDEVVLVGGSSRIPLVQRRVTDFFHKEPRRTVNPDEVVALGAAVQAGVISGEVKGIVLLDVTSLSLGVETHDGQTAIVIPRNTTIPTEAMRTFTTAVDNQTSVEVHVVQGEAEVSRLNDSLGRFDLDGLRPQPAGAPQIDVTFAIDLNGMVKVSARDRGTGRSQTVSVSARTGMSREPALADSGASAEESPKSSRTSRTPSREQPAREAPRREPPAQRDAARDSSHEARSHHPSPKESPAREIPARDTPARESAPKDPPVHDAAPTESPARDVAPEETPSRDGISKDRPRARGNTLPSIVQATLLEAEQLLGQHGDKIAGTERSSLQTGTAQLRAMVITGGAQPEDLERSRVALRQIVSQVKENLLASRRAR